MCKQLMVGNGGGNQSVRNRKVLLGIGYFVQGLRCFPWMAVKFFLKDGLRVEPSTLQILYYSSYLPMVAKPIYGILSDSFYIFGQHRLPYVALGAFLQAVAWIAIAIFPSSISFLRITICLLLSNLGAAIAEVANEAIVAETGKQPTTEKSKPSSSSELQSFVWMASSLGKFFGNLIGGIVLNQFSPQAMFLTFGILLGFQLLISLIVHENTLDLPRSPSHVSFRKQLSEILIALQKHEISHSILWFAISYAIIPVQTSTMFYYHTRHLKIDSSLLGMSKVFGQAGMLLWGVAYKHHLKSISSRKLIAAVQISMAIFTLSELLFVNKIFSRIGIPDSAYIVIFSGLPEVIYFFKILPFSVLMAQLCPSGCEGSVMAFVMSASALAFIVSGYLGVVLASFVGVTGDDFSGLARVLWIQAICTLLPLFWSSCIPEDFKSKTKTKET